MQTRKTKRSLALVLLLGSLEIVQWDFPANDHKTRNDINFIDSPANLVKVSQVYRSGFCIRKRVFLSANSQVIIHSHHFHWLSMVQASIQASDWCFFKWTLLIRFSDRLGLNCKNVNIIKCRFVIHARILRGTQRQFSKNICSEDDLRSRIFGTFVVKFLACLPLLGFSNF